MTFAEDYNTVPERIVEFRARYPEGTLQATILHTPGDVPGWVVEARAYRTPDDERPGIGLAFEPVPGKTNFTRDSELQNCETSAWGRAIIAVGAADAKKGIASAEDIRNRTGAGDNMPVHTPVAPSASAGTASHAPPSGGQPADAPASEEVLGDGEAPGTSSEEPSHVHGDWTAAPRDGWMLCGRQKNGKPCGFAERGERVNA